MTDDRRTRTLRQLALTALLLMLVVTSVSALLRLTQPRPACPVWPNCRGNVVQQIASEQRPGLAAALVVARAVHRTAASLALIVVLLLALVALARRPRNWRVGGPALALLGLALGLSVLGIVTPGSRANAVLLGNLFGGFLMLAIAWQITQRYDSSLDLDVGRRFIWWVLAAAALWMTQAAFGALAGTGRSGLAANVHASLALVAALAAYHVGALANRSGLAAIGIAVIAMVFIQWLLGVSAAVLGAPVSVVLIHNFSAAVVLALLLGLLWRLWELRHTRLRHVTTARDAAVASLRG